MLRPRQLPSGSAASLAASGIGAQGCAPFAEWPHVHPALPVAGPSMRLPMRHNLPVTTGGDLRIAPAAGLAALKLQSRIYELRGVHVMLDSDLAELYEVETGNLNKAVARNLGRFPPDFMFRLTEQEVDSMRFQFGISNVSGQSGTGELRFQSATSNAGRGGRRYLPYAFTEQGVAMLSGVLRSPRAVRVNIAIMRAFVELRRWARGNGRAGLRARHCSRAGPPALRRART